MNWNRHAAAYEVAGWIFFAFALVWRGLAWAGGWAKKLTFWPT